MKKIVIYVLLGLLVIVGVIIFMVLSNPLRKSTEKIREDILKLTPIGTSKEDVIKFIEENQDSFKKFKHYEHYDVYTHHNYGFSIKNNRVVMRYQGYQYNDSEMIGKETIEATIGQYIKFFEVIVFAYWAFDQDGKLVDVAITKTSNSF